jgi:hypothetical protein
LCVVASVETLNDALLYSLFKQARFLGYDIQTQRVSVELSKDFILFKELLDNSKEMWQPLLRTVFSFHATLDAQFTGINKIEREKVVDRDTIVEKDKTVIHHKEKISQPPRSQEQFYSGNRYNNNKKVVAVGSQKNELYIDVSDESVWKTASMIIRHFPGVISEIRENR